MADRLSRPRTGADWLRWIEGSIARVEKAIRSKVTPPVGSMVVLGGGGTPPPGWLLANGATISGTTWPLLVAQLGGTTLPNPAAVSGAPWIIRAA